METREPLRPEFPPELRKRFDPLSLKLRSDDVMETVWDAEDEELKCQVALRCLPKAKLPAWSATAKERALRQWQMMPRVRSVRVERVFHYLEASNCHVLVTEEPLGETLEQRLAQGPMSIEEVCRVCMQVCEGLQAMHAANVVYRGLSPKAVCLSAEGEVRLATLPFAKTMSGSLAAPSLTPGNAEPFERAALPPYCAPEMTQGKDATARSDVYSVGCLLYRCLVGEDPFELPGQQATGKDLVKVRPDCPTALAQVIRKCLLTLPQARYQTAENLRKAIEASLEKERRRMVVPWWLLAAAAAILIAVASDWAWGGQEPLGVEPSLRAGYERRLALLVCMQDSKFGNLNNPAYDGGNVEKCLKDLGWTVTTLMTKQDTKQEELRRALSTFDVGRNDAVLFYFAGHGLADAGGQPSLVCSDTSDNSDLAKMLFAKDLAKFQKAKHVLYVLDSCFSAAMATALKKEFEGSSWNKRGITAENKAADPATQAFGRWILASAVKAAEDGKKADKASPFCMAFLDALSKAHADGKRIDIDDLHKHVGDWFERNQSEQEQTPHLEAVCVPPAKFILWHPQPKSAAR